jgi:hypothetical protein
MVLAYLKKMVVKEEEIVVVDAHRALRMNRSKNQLVINEDGAKNHKILHHDHF